MAPMKRKVAAEATRQRPEKKPRREPETKAVRTIIVAPETLFPRGGSGGLTPLERKEIQAQATQDALFEQQTGKKVVHDDYGDEEGIAKPNGTMNGYSGLKHRDTQRRKSGAMRQDESESKVRVEGLSYKVCIEFIEARRT